MLLTMLQDSEDLLNEVVSEEKTLSIYKLIMDGGVGGQVIIAILIVLFLSIHFHLLRPTIPFIKNIGQVSTSVVPPFYSKSRISLLSRKYSQLQFLSIIMKRLI